MREVKTLESFNAIYGPAYEVQPVCGPETFVRRRPLFVEDLSGRALSHNLLERVQMTSPRIVLASYDSPSVRGLETIITRSGHVITRYEAGDADRLRTYAADQGGDFGNVDTGIRIDNGRILIEDREEIVLDGPHALISPEEGYNYGIWLLQLIPYLQYLEDVGYDGRLLCFADAGWQPKLLDFMGVGDRVVRQEKGRAYRGNGPFKAFRHQFRNLTLSGREREAFARLARRPDIAAATPAHERLFVSRRSRSVAHPSYRMLVNEAELLEAVAALGFHVIEPELLSFAEQISLFSKAKTVVGLGGAGMFSTVFCAPDTTVVSIESSNIWIEAHANLFASAGVQYGIIFGAEDMSVDQEYHKPWSVDVPAASRAIASVL